MAQLLAAEFFPKFHAILHEWLIGAPNYGEIEQWYSWWKEQIPASIRDVPPLNAEWTKALTTMGQAMDLGDRAAEELPAPEAVQHRHHHRSHLVADRSTSATPSTTARSTAAEPLPELTFRDVVEEWCTENDLLLIALRQAHEQTGAPLYRITASADQKGGFVCYIRGDVLFARNKKAKSVWEPVGLEDALVERASAR
jgi:tuftelin-interacting protein 11